MGGRAAHAGAWVGCEVVLCGKGDPGPGEPGRPRRRVLSAVHHWSDRAAGLAEAMRVLTPGARVFLVERLSPPGARGHQRYGMAEAQLDALEQDATRAGFVAVRREMHGAARDTLAVVRGSKPRA